MDFDITYFGGNVVKFWLTFKENCLRSEDGSSILVYSTEISALI
jgi:hypothetical protein